MKPPTRILLMGASGYVGGRLLKVLVRRGLPVRCLARRPEILKVKVPEDTEIVQGDIQHPASIEKAMEGIQTVYYLVHSMAAGSDFEKLDRRAAFMVGRAAARAGVKRLIYLGGLANPVEKLSHHLRSRHEVGAFFRLSPVQVIEFRASIIIGSGSLSFEMIRGLVERLPLMITPKWVRTPAQPIAIEDVISYLTAALEWKEHGHRIFEIGGADVVSYGQIMREYAHQRRLQRFMISIPFLTPRLSSLWLGLVTPIYARVGRHLIESLRHATVVMKPDARDAFPDIHPRGIRAAIHRALMNEDHEISQTHWSDALSSAGHLRHWGGVRFGTRLLDSRTAAIALPPNVVFRAVRRIGGKTGWYFANFLWRLRGLLDLLVGGVGMRRGRRHSEWLRVGDTVDFYRVREYEPNRRILLEAELKLPGRAWLQFEVEPTSTGSILRQTAIFDPLGAFGIWSWYLLYPFHKIIFVGMIRRIARAADQLVPFPPREVAPT